MDNIECFSGKIHFFIFIAIVVILLLNLLIAMMGDTYAKIAEIKNEWMRQVTVTNMLIMNVLVVLVSFSITIPITMMFLSLALVLAIQYGQQSPVGANSADRGERDCSG